MPGPASNPYFPSASRLRLIDEHTGQQKQHEFAPKASRNGD